MSFGKEYNETLPSLGEIMAKVIQVFAKTQPIRLPSSVDNMCSGENVLAGSELVIANIVTKLKQAEKPLLYLGDRLKHNT